MIAALLITNRQENNDFEDSSQIGVGNYETVDVAFDRWKTNYERYAQGKLVMALRWSKGLSVERTRAVGSFVLDLAEGSVDVKVNGLEEPHSVWILDNREGPGRSVRAEAGDGLVHLGVLQKEGEGWRLEKQLDRERLEGIQIDRVIVSKAGDHPANSGLLFGSPTLFQKIYHGLKLEQQDPGSEVATAGFGFLVPVLAHRSHGHGLKGLVALGEKLFFEETFNGNGRTCGSCHPANNNFTLDPLFIAKLPANDPLFVAEYNPDLKDLEKPKLMHELGLILENVDGFDRPGVMRSVPHILAMGTRLTPPPLGDDGKAFDGTDPAVLERTGWGGDGSPGGGTLREFAIGAIIQHAPRTLNRVEGQDFRLPTEKELDAMEAFQLSVGRASDPDLKTMKLKSPIADKGRELFMVEQAPPGSPGGFGGASVAKCHTCHSNGGATVSDLFVETHNLPAGRYSFTLDIGATGGDRMGEYVMPGEMPVDAGFGKEENDEDDGGGYGLHAMNVPPLIEAADTGPFFHDHQMLTLEGTIFFYRGGFNFSPGVRKFLRPIETRPLAMDDQEMSAIGAFLRVMNALENIRSAKAYLQGLPHARRPQTHARQYAAAMADIGDGIDVLKMATLHPHAIKELRKARYAAAMSTGFAPFWLKKACFHLDKARSHLIQE